MFTINSHTCYNKSFFYDHRIRMLRKRSDQRLMTVHQKSGHSLPGNPPKASMGVCDHPMLIHQCPHAAWTWAFLYCAQMSLKIITTNPSAAALQTMHLSGKTLKCNPSACHQTTNTWLYNKSIVDNKSYITFTLIEKKYYSLFNFFPC